MGRKLTNLTALGVLIGAVFAFGGRDLTPARTSALGAPTGDDAADPAAPTDVPYGPGLLVVDLVDGADPDDLEAVERVLGADLDWVHPLSVDEALAQGEVVDLRAAVAALRGQALVEVVEPALQMEAFGGAAEFMPPAGNPPAAPDSPPRVSTSARAFPDDPMYDKQWNLRAMGAPEGWSLTSRGDGVIVAVVDTGVARVEDLEGTTLLPGATFVPGTNSSTDDQGHGTHVAGTIAQTTNNGKGVAGVAPSATILPVKVLSKFGFGSSAWIASGIDYAVDNGADVINLSLGGGYSAVIHNAIKKARQNGVIVVAAAGNSGRKGVGYPGALEETIGVSATGPDGKLAFYSSWGKGVDLAAPGGDKRVAGGGILQDTIDGKGGHAYLEYQGTSMATPHVAGAAAVLLSHGIPADAVERVLLSSARRDWDGWNEKYGNGHLDLGAALGRMTSEHGGIRFALGAVMAFLVAQLAATRRGFQLSSSLWAGITAGGLFFLPSVPGIPEWSPLEALSRGLLEWPAVFLGPDWSHFPLWLSAALPLVIAFTLGAFRSSRALALGITCGIGAHLFHGAATGTLEPWWLPTFLGVAWLGLNASLCVLLGLGLAGAQKLEEEELRR